MVWGALHTIFIQINLFSVLLDDVIQLLVISRNYLNLITPQAFVSLALVVLCM